MKDKTKKIPKHIGFIMDGNGRWATKRGLPRKVGHREGVNALERVVAACAKFGVEVATVYAFSTENWSRPQKEIDAIFGMIIDFSKKNADDLNSKNIKVKFIGSKDGLSDELLAAICDIENLTANNTAFTLLIALNYGGRADIAQAVNKIKDKEVITEADILNNLYTAGYPEVDLIVRSGGEYRLSNFLLYQASYAELIFTYKLWPDFDEITVLAAIEEYADRVRRFGDVKEAKC